ncbi:MAG: ABC transporter permease [Acidimicrobiia bacterium]|nr:ABC transporter permease [Acidimicrobiia bacterium]
MSRHLSLIFKNSLRNKRRSVLTILSIAVSLCLLGVLMALYHSFFHSEAPEEQALRLIVRNRVSLANPLPLSYKQRIAGVNGVKDVMVFQWFGGTYKDARDPANFFARFAVDPEKLSTNFPEYKMSEDQWKAFLSEQTACIVGRKTAARHNMRPGMRVVLAGDIFPVKLQLTVRGIYDADRDNENMFFHFKYLNESLSQGQMDHVGTFSVRLERVEDAGMVAKAIDDMFRNAPLQTKTETEKAFELSFIAFLGNVKAFLLLICGAVTFTILLVAGNTMAMSVRERVREVGILKTLGYTPGAVMGLLMGESVAMSILGGGIGLGLAYGLCAVLRESPSMFTDMSRITVPPPVALIAMGVAAAIGILSCVVPAYNASRRPIVEALRFTD